MIAKMDPVTLNKINEEYADLVHGGSTDPKNKKKLFSKNMTENSEEFKQLGNLHKENRVTDYYPQDVKADFSTKPKNFMGKTDYDEDGYFTGARQPTNLVGESYKQVRHTQDEYNRTMMAEQQSNRSNQSHFPRTTNQDFHSEEVFDKAQKYNVSKKNYKKKNNYSSYVDAMFNAGVFTSPLMDQC
jgi:hypothetical protein